MEFRRYGSSLLLLSLKYQYFLGMTYGQYIFLLKYNVNSMGLSTLPIESSIAPTFLNLFIVNRSCIFMVRNIPINICLKEYSS